MSDDPYNPSPVGNPSVLARRNWWQTRLILILVRITPKCPEVARLLSRSMDTRLSLRTRLIIRLHFLYCCWCQRYEKHLHFIRKVSREYDHHCNEFCTDHLSAAAREKLKRALQDELGR